ncbi:MAG: D-glycero-beta-D-manno-heptose 1,7-bisphosphate 7-phosphatase [Burkholderiales bacterium]|nr:D-glycero-beta-D-manno-heptose 1,7-bisphosphate 7-phosphatase [Burkholderiales bacterium]
MRTPLVILDREGVLTECVAPFMRSPDDFRPIPGAFEAVGRLTQAGVRVVVATNQAGVGRGLFDMATVNAIHDRMSRAALLAGGRIDAVFYCPHPEDARCACRKPRTGMFDEIAERFGLRSLAGVPAVGDSIRDLQAASAAGALPVLVRTGKGRETESVGSVPEGVVAHDDLGGFVDDWLRTGV